MNIKMLFPIALLGLITTSSAYAEKPNEVWKGYVCRVIDFPDCEKGKSRVYPSKDVFKDKESCIAKFGKLIEDDPEMSKKYPQVDDIKKSYIYDCEKKVDKSI